ncbi:hypothetical protein J3F83DRAFT_559434 [Trichoderma novae-zelandiae]
MTSPPPPGVIQLSSNRPAGQRRRLEPHPSSVPQSFSRQIGEGGFSQMHHPGPTMIPPHSSSMPSQQGGNPHAHTSIMMPPHNPRSLHRSAPEPRSRQNIDVFDIRDENITEAEAYRRLASYIVIRIERATDPYDVDSEGNTLPPTWEKASHLIRRDVSQQDARRKVRKLDKETGSVTHKKNDLPSAIQRQLEHAWSNLEKTEADPRFVYTLAQVDWKRKSGETVSREKRHGRRGKDGKRSKERHRSKGSSRSKTKGERVSVTAYFKREPARNENCVRMLKAQLAERRQGGRTTLDEYLPTMIPGQPPLPRPVQAIPPQTQTRQPVFEPQIQCRLPINQPLNAMAHHPVRSAPPPFPPPPPPPPPRPQPLSSSLPVRIPLSALPQSSSTTPIPIPPRSSIPQAIEAQNRRIQSYAPRMERQATTGSYNSRSSVTSFSSLSTDDSGTNRTPGSSIEQTHSLPPPHLHHRHHHHLDRSRGRGRYRQHRIEDEAVVLEVARPQRPHNPADRFIGIPPAAPDPIKAVPEADMLRRVEQRAYRDDIMDAQQMARSMTEGSTPRQPRVVQDFPESQTGPMYQTARFPSRGNDEMDRLGDRLSRTSLADGPRNRPEQARDPVIHYEYREAMRRYRDDDDDDDDGFVVPGPVPGTWRRQAAQRYTAERRRTDQDAWDLGDTSPVRYGEGQRRVSGYAGEGRG